VRKINETTARPLQLVPSSNHEKRPCRSNTSSEWLSAALLVSATFAARADEAVPRQTLTFGGIKRTYVVRAPADLPRSGPRVPLVLVLHGGGNAVNAEQMTGFTEKARKEEQATFWARADGCTGAPLEDSSGPRILWRHSCPTGRAVELYLVKDNGHAWPGGQPGSRRGDPPSSSLNATDVIWEFFKAHPK
jgi:poly(3-hydroxybutyrate) depolymerase